MSSICNTVGIGPTQYARSIFSEYAQVDNPLISEYISSIPGRLSDAVKRIGDQLIVTKGENILSNRRKLSRHISAFHSQAGTDLPGVKRCLGNLCNPSTQIFISIHQPNLFSYGGVFKKIVLLQTIKSLLEKQNDSPKDSFVNLFVIVDHDFMDDVWIRAAQLPSIRHTSGNLELRMPVPGANRWKLACKMPVPPIAIVDHWRKQVVSWIQNGCSSLGIGKSERLVLLGNLEEFWMEVDESFSRAKSYADLNSFIMSRVVNRKWGYDTLFVRLSDLSEVFEEGLNFLLRNFRKYARILSENNMMFLRNGIDTGVSPSTYLNAPVWLNCRCGSKASIKLHEISGNILELSGTCMSCRKYLALKLEKTNTRTIPNGLLNELSPRAIPILLLLSKDLGPCCYASGTGGSRGYTMLGMTAFKQLSVKMPFTVVWASNDVYSGMGQSEALESLDLSNSAEILKYGKQLKKDLISFSMKITPLLSKRTDLVRDGKDIKDVLEELFLLKQEQRKIRQLLKANEKVKKAVTLKPCIIDYIVNFGLKNTENIWRSSLIRNDDLGMPVLMRV